MRRILLFAAAAALLAMAAASGVPSPGASAPGPSAAGGCQPETFQEARYTVCRFDVRSFDVRLFWGEDDVPYRTFSELSRSLAAKGAHLVFAINGGMYGEDWRPTGLLVENGLERRAVNRVNTPSGVRPIPNFYKQPNGIFYVSKGKAAVTTTERFVRDKPKVEFATQSGPMLVIDGKLHPAFRAGSNEKTQRSGVGIVMDTTVVFAISEDWVNFDQFARLFRDRLGARNALFLDGGTAPGIHAPGLARSDPPGHGGYGPIIGVVPKAAAIPR
jgi:uncharacterized protein YigE (DUF2233 family)